MTTQSIAPDTSSGFKMPSRFPFLDLRAQFSTIREEVEAAVLEVLESQNFILGSKVENFENEFAEYVGCRFAVGCASGSDALLLAMMALGIREHDEVITTPFTFVATAGSIARLKARPVFVDIDPQTYNIAPEGIESAITPKTRVIIPVHLFGLAAEMVSIVTVASEHGLAVIEDAAQAIGATINGDTVGQIGTVGCFSFFPSKNLGAAGDGGMLTTNDPAIANKLKLLRVHGSRRKYEYELLGINSRLDAIQAALLGVKLRHLPKWTAGRQRNAETYRRLFAQANLEQWISLPLTPPGRTHVYNQFVIRATRRDALQNYLRSHGIPTEVYYPAPLHLQPAFAYLGYRGGDLPVAESISKEVLALPIFPELTESQIGAVVETIADFYHKPNS